MNDTFKQKKVIDLFCARSSNKFVVWCGWHKKVKAGLTVTLLILEKLTVIFGVYSPVCFYHDRTSFNILHKLCLLMLKTALLFRHSISAYQKCHPKVICLFETSICDSITKASCCLLSIMTLERRKMCGMFTGSNDHVSDGKLWNLLCTLSVSVI